MRLIKSILVTFILTILCLGVNAESRDSVSVNPHESIAQQLHLSKAIFEHVNDAYTWDIVKWGNHSIEIPLPVIIRSKYSGWHIFMSSKLKNIDSQNLTIAPETSKYANRIVEKTLDGGEYRPLDLSITKNVVALIINSIILLLVILFTAKWYKKHNAVKEAPKGVAAVMEPVIMMVHNLAKENIGEEEYRKFSPFLCTVFLFILLNNLMGILPGFPGGANVMGNITITLVLALFTFFIVHIWAKKEYYKEIFEPDVPLWMKPLMIVIEIFSDFMKPLSLTIRLFANMMAGHLQTAGTIFVIFIMAKYGGFLFGSMSFVSVVFGIFLDLLEILISFIQAYIFTILSSLYIGMARGEI